MMMKWKEKIAVYLRTALHKRCRAVVGIMVCLGLMLVTLLCYETTVSSKQLLLSLFLCVSSGVLIVFPMPDHRYISIPMVLLYLLLIPSKLFVRIEYPVHDMSRILPGAKLVNVLTMLLIYACCLLIFQRVHRALGFGTIFIMIVSLVNFYLNAFRGSSLTFNDLLATKTAMTVMDNYQLFMTWELWYSILYFVVFSCLGFWCKIPASGGGEPQGMMYLPEML